LNHRPQAESAPEPQRNELADRWGRLTLIATLAVLPIWPLAFLIADARWPDQTFLVKALIATVAMVVVRGLLDVLFHRWIPWPSLFGDTVSQYQERDARARRRAWFWTSRLRFTRLFLISPVFWLLIFGLIGGIVFLWLKWAAFLIDTVASPFGYSPGSTIVDAIGESFSNPAQGVQLLLTLLMLFFINFAILFGPLVAMGIGQIQSFEPGDASWGVKLADVRGQAEPKEEIRRVVTLWQSGEMFEKAGGKRERGLLFLGPPGTGKTMLAKAIATGFNCPFVSIPGSGFAQTFIGMDAVIVRFLARKAKRLARKWGGQCIVFIDEIDAVGMRRASLGRGYEPLAESSALLYGPQGALTASGDVILETAAWREFMFNQREPRVAVEPPAAARGLNRIARIMMPGGMMGGGGLALNQLLVVMDGIGNPSFGRKMLGRLNTLFDALYFIPSRVGRVSLRLPPAKLRKEQIYFIGACNVPLEALDPALTRPGRMGRHIRFRTPTKDDRKDIFDLYLAKVAHEADLDSDKRRDEMGRITNGYSPAMIEQVCSMALTIAHHEGRPRFGWTDMVEAMTTVESGMAVNIEYVADETRSVAIHEAGHATAAHVYVPKAESTRLSIRMRGGSLGHHQALERDERFSGFRSDDMGILIWILGAMAAEYVFYGENSRGVAGDVQSITRLAARMVGVSAMSPERVDLEGKFTRRSEEDEARERIMKRFEVLGGGIMNRAQGGAQTGDYLGAVLMDPGKRSAAAQIIGQAYVIAWNFVDQNKAAVERVAETLIERREMHGDEVVELLDEVGLVKPLIDLTEERSWPKV
jgi:cell division protease FtsH